MDLNQIVYYGKKDGTLENDRQRLFFSLCDGIIGGQGDGPLKPKPLALGVVSFTNTSGWNDLVLSQLMGWNLKKFHYWFLQETFEKNAKVVFKLNGNTVNFRDYSKLAVKAEMPPGWMEYNKEYNMRIAIHHIKIGYHPDG